MRLAHIEPSTRVIDLTGPSLDTFTHATEIALQTGMVIAGVSIGLTVWWAWVRLRDIWRVTR